MARQLSPAGLTPATRILTATQFALWRAHHFIVLCLCFAHVPHHSLFAFAFSTQIPKSGKLGAKVINDRTSTRVIVAMHLLTFCYLAWVQRVLGRAP